MTNFKILTCLIGTLCVFGLVSCSKKVSYEAPASISEAAVLKLSIAKRIAYNFVTASKTESGSFESILSETFVSHDQSWNGDKEAFIEKRNADLTFSSIQPVRIIQDDSLVAIHSRMLGDTLKFRWDIVKMANLEIQEHWSNVQDSIGVNPDGHSEIDGPTVLSQAEKTDANRALIARFMDQCMIREDGGASKFFNFGLYIQHNRDVGDGLGGLLWAMLKMKKEGHTIKFKHNYHVIAEGNFVLSATEGYVGEDKTTFFDFFRIEENKIVEHWDIIAPVNKFIYFKETN